MVEAMVALAILAVVIAVIVTALVSIRSSASTQLARTSSSADGRVVQRRFANDLARLHAPARSQSDLQLIRGLAGACPTDIATGLCSGADGNSPNSRLHDIVSASPTQLTFWADVNERHGTELVTWRLVTGRFGARGQEWRIERSVTPSIAEGGAAAGSWVETIAWGLGGPPLTTGCPADPATPSVRLFCLRELGTTGAGATSLQGTDWRSSGCDEVWDAPWNRAAATPVGWHDAGMVQVRRGGSLGRVDGMSRMDRIVELALTVDPRVSVGGKAVTMPADAWIGIRNRLTPQYLAALACGRR